jgi:hypothetical protein
MIDVYMFLSFGDVLTGRSFSRVCNHWQVTSALKSVALLVREVHTVEDTLGCASGHSSRPVILATASTWAR